MADLHSALCTCPEKWAGEDERPECPLHEGGKLPRGYGRRTDGTVVNVLASAGFARGPREHGTWSSNVSQPSGIVSYGRT